jgi:hypothetical protein
MHGRPASSLAPKLSPVPTRSVLVLLFDHRIPPPRPLPRACRYLTFSLAASHASLEQAIAAERYDTAGALQAEVAAEEAEAASLERAWGFARPAPQGPAPQQQQAQQPQEQQLPRPRQSLELHRAASGRAGADTVPGPAAHLPLVVPAVAALLPAAGTAQLSETQPDTSIAAPSSAAAIAGGTGGDASDRDGEHGSTEGYQPPSLPQPPRSTTAADSAAGIYGAAVDAAGGDGLPGASGLLPPAEHAASSCASGGGFSRSSIATGVADQDAPTAPAAPGLDTERE